MLPSRIFIPPGRVDFFLFSFWQNRFNNSARSFDTRGIVSNWTAFLFQMKNFCIFKNVRLFLANRIFVFVETFERVWKVEF